jgi:hypothetical protein
MQLSQPLVPTGRTAARTDFDFGHPGWSGGLGVA